MKKYNVKRDEYRKVLTRIQKIIGMKALATRNLNSVEDCDNAVLKIVNEYAFDIRNTDDKLENKKLKDKLKELLKENQLLRERQMKKSLFQRIIAAILG